MRQLVAWENHRERLEELNCQIIAASSDSEEDTTRISQHHKIRFVLAHSVTRVHANALGAGWSDDHAGHIEPTEFILTQYGLVLGSMYASGPVGRMDPEEAIQLIQGREKQRAR